MARALDTDLVYAFFDASNMHRWNDHLRPLDLTELDKQAHKVSTRRMQAIAWTGAS
jgi:putative hydrolase of HD superfamily